MAVTSESTAAGLAPEPVLIVDDDPVQHALVGKYLQATGRCGTPIPPPKPCTSCSGKTSSW